MRSERGFALVAALWLLVALSVIGLEFSLRSHARNLAVANALEASRAAGAAAAGLADAQALLMSLAREPAASALTDVSRMLDPWSGSLGPGRDTLRLGDSRAVVDLQDANARLNLNHCTEEELLRLFVALRMDFGQADQLAQTIMDWQDSDDFHRARGAERADYLLAGLPVLPTNRAFDRLYDLSHVAGVTSETYDRIRPHLTLLGTGQVNLNTAGRPVILALPGLTDPAVTVLLRKRESGRPIRTLAELGNELPPAPRAALQERFGDLSARASFDTREIIAEVDGWMEASPVHVRVTALFARAGGNAVLTWWSQR